MDTGSHTEILENKKFCFQMAILMLLLAVYLSFKGRSSGWIALMACCFFLLTGFCKPILIKNFRLRWMQLGELMGKINSVIILTLLYFLIVTPIGWLQRLTGRDILERSGKKDKRSNWQEPDVHQSMNNQY